MGRKYRNPPVVEALCEFQFIPSQPWDITILGLIYERIKDKFPKKQQQFGVGIQLQPTDRGVEHRIEPVPPRIQFRKEDETALIQIAPDLLVVNQLKPYPTWENFKSVILENFNVYREIANPKGFRRIGLRYINIFEFDKLGIELTEYFRYYPSIPEDLLQTHTSFLVRVELPFEDGNEILILTLGSIVPSKPDVISLVLDIDYAMIKPDYISLDSIVEWLERAHKQVERAFESSITDKTRDLFGKEGE